MKTNRQARHILGMDYKVSNQRTIVNSEDKPTVVTHRTGRHRRAKS